MPTGTKQSLGMMAGQAGVRDVVDKLDGNQLYRDHARFVARVIRRLTGDGPHVDDLLQEVFVAAHRQRNRFEGSCSVQTWLYAIAANQCRNHHRSRTRFWRFLGRYAAEPEPESSPLPSEALERHALVAMADRWMGKLPFEQREVMVLYELEEMEGKEIAEMVGIPLGTVWTRLHQARKRLRRLMRRELGEEELL